MTQEEIKKIPFRFASHLSMTDQYQTMYVDDSGRPKHVSKELYDRIGEMVTNALKAKYVELEKKFNDL